MSNAGGYNNGSGGVGGRASAVVFGAMWALLFFGTFLVAGPWAGFHGVLLGMVGLLMLLCPPVVRLPRAWWILAGVFVVAGSSAFLPAGWFAMPEWRGKLQGLGVDTGTLVAIQAQQAAEALTMFGIILFTGLWLAGHRPTQSQLRLWAMAFTLGVAAYAILSKVMQNSLPALGGEHRYGFFPNRNHTATYLAMGTLCGLGNVLQALRDRRFAAMVVAIIATAVCMWAVAGWSVSRGGVVLVAIGCLIWLPMLGRGYLGKNGLRALCLIGLAGAGLFFIADTGVKERFSKSVEKAGNVLSPIANSTPAGGKPELETTRDLDFRIPTALDTLGMIRDYKWTGIGAGQFYYIFPQYRNLTAAVNDADNSHPESDWLWLAAETGLPATLGLVALVILAAWKSLRSILGGRDRALRGACLVAALLVPIHGMFDVPGHRITLALSAAFLFVISLSAPSSDTAPKSPPAWPFRLAAVALLVIAGFLIRAQWLGGPQPALTVASTTLAEAQRLYQEDQATTKAAKADDLAIQPSDDAPDPLEKALNLLEQARKTVPLDRGLLRYQGFLGLHFVDKGEEIRKSFQIERELDPTWVEAPLQQALAWSNADPEESAQLWREALRRARWLDQQHAGSQWSEARTRARILEQVRGKPLLESRFKVLLGE